MGSLDALGLVRQPSPWSLDSPLDWRVHGWVVGGAEAPLAIPQTIPNQDNHHDLHLFHSPHPARRLPLRLRLHQHLCLHQRRCLRLWLQLRRRAQRPAGLTAARSHQKGGRCSGPRSFESAAASMALPSAPCCESRTLVLHVYPDGIKAYWGSPDSVDTDQVVTEGSVRAAMNCCS